ncbi:MAG: hypothetical protein HY886_03360 [Deltaproteobacteria bacterium]|nr:hypothetical protein [Deltaproteobacteria bacterium]
MTTYAFMVNLMSIAFKKSILCLLLAAFISSCASTREKSPAVQEPKAPTAHKPVVAPRPRPVDTEAQQSYYDSGLQHYLKEDYDEAKKAFQQAVQIGPDTALGLKAKENLKKIAQILKTLYEIESK